MTGISRFTIFEKDSKKKTQKTKDLDSIESKETYWPTESLRTENEDFFSNPLRKSSNMCAKKNYNNSLIHLKAKNNKEDEKNKGFCSNFYCSFSLCK